MDLIKIGILWNWQQAGRTVLFVREGISHVVMEPLWKDIVGTVKSVTLDTSPE